MAGTRAKKAASRKKKGAAEVEPRPASAPEPESPAVEAPPEPEPADNRLTARRRAFAREYPKDHNATQAAIRAGFAPSGAAVEGSRLLRNPKVALLIEQAEERAALAAGVSTQYVLENAVEILERCMQRRPVEYFDKVEKMMVQATDEDGNDLWEFDSNGAIKAVTLLAKHTGGFSDKVEVSGTLKLEDLVTHYRQ